MKPGQRPTFVTEMIAGLFTPPVIETVAVALRGMEDSGVLPGGWNLDELEGIHSAPHLFGTAAGPFPGIAAAVMTWFQLTVVYAKDIMVLFADDSLYGVAPFDPVALMHPDPDDFAYLPLPRPRIARR
jgi:hypothetical protein